MILFVENKKDPSVFNLKPEEFSQAKTYDEAVSFWETGKFDEIYLDYDLDSEEDGYDFLEYIIKIKKPSYVKIISISLIGIDHLKKFCEENKIKYDIEGFETYNKNDGNIFE